jgi:hypothetical protein
MKGNGCYIIFFLCLEKHKHTQQHIKIIIRKEEWGEKIRQLVMLDEYKLNSYVEEFDKKIIVCCSE